MGKQRSFIVSVECEMQLPGVLNVTDALCFSSEPVLGVSGKRWGGPTLGCSLGFIKLFAKRRLD